MCPFDYIPPGKKVVGNRLVNIPKNVDNPYQVIERLKAQIGVLEQRVNSDELGDVQRALQEKTDLLAEATKRFQDAEAKVKGLEATVKEQASTIAQLDDQNKILKGNDRVKRGEAPPPLTVDMKEMADLKEALAAAQAQIAELTKPPADDAGKGSKAKK